MSAFASDSQKPRAMQASEAFQYSPRILKYYIGMPQKATQHEASENPRQKLTTFQSEWSLHFDKY